MDGLLTTERGQEPREDNGPTIYVYFSNGQMRPLKAHRVLLYGDKVLFLDEDGTTVGRFPSNSIYMCTRTPLPGALF